MRSLIKKGERSAVPDFFPLGPQRAVKQHRFIYIVDRNHTAVTPMPKWHISFCFGTILGLAKANRQYKV